MKKREIAVLFGQVLLLLLISCKGGDNEVQDSGRYLDFKSTTSSCDQRSKEFVAYMYASAFSYPENFGERIRIAAGQSDDKRWVDCAKELAAVLANQAAGLVPRQDISDKILRIAGQYGRPDLGLDVTNSMFDQTKQMRALAQQLITLTDVTASILEGNISAADSPVFILPRQLWYQISLVYTEATVNSRRQINHAANRWLILECYRYSGL